MPQRAGFMGSDDDPHVRVWFPKSYTVAMPVALLYAFCALVIIVWPTSLSAPDSRAVDYMPVRSSSHLDSAGQGLVTERRSYLDVRNSSITGLDHPVPATQELLNSVIINGKYLVVATANIAHLAFVLNWHESVQRHLDLGANVLVVALDDELLATLQARHIPVVSIRQLFNPMHQDQNNLDEEALKAEHQYGSETYNRLVNMKIDVAYILLKYYDFEYLIYTDIDLVWLQPRLIDYFDVLFNADDKQFDAFFASIGKGSFQLCTGFYLMRKSNFSIDFLGSILASADKKGSDDQVIANTQYNHLSSYDRLKIHILEPVLFVDGSTIDWRALYGVKPWLFHANYVAGFDDKKNYLKRAGYWYLD